MKFSTLSVFLIGCSLSFVLSHGAIGKEKDEDADDSESDKALFHGSPFVSNNAAEWRRASAISYVRDVTTPLLILSDTGDNRDPFATSAMYYRALRDNGKQVTFVAYPVQGHFPGDPVRQSDVYGRWLEYIAQHFR